MPKKIFELAKEIGVGSIELVEKLKKEGFDVKSHMSSLADDDLEKVTALFASKEEPKKKKAKKKKAAKKKTAKKKTVKKKLTASSAEEEAKEEEPKKKTKKKSTVIRRKTASKKVASEDPETSTEPSDSSTPSTNVEETSTSEKVVASENKEQKPPVESKSTKSQEADSSSKYTAEQLGVSGLRVVSKPDQKEVEELKRKEELRIKDRETKAKEGDTTSDPSAANADSKKDVSSKKRLGGLATMMTNKKGINKSQILNETRAENELKSYSSLSGGRPLYSQVKKKRTYMGPTQKTEVTEVKDSKRIVQLHKGGTVEELAQKLSVKVKELINECLELNLLVKPSDYVGINLASKIADLYRYRVEDKAFNEEEVLSSGVQDKSSLPTRDPIITIMGHVDHGKTTLLDYIRSAKVASGEAGGITQHIGAYSVKTKNKKTLSFLDTPGHSAFASMRQRGANVTDIVILVVAADDGVMPQTRESIKFCENAGVPIIIAVNKMDKEGANPDKVKQELVEFNLTPEDWGGDTQFVPISALKGEGIDELLEAVALQAEMLELKADPKGKAKGVVIESKVEQGRGPVATILVQEGTLRKGDSIVVGETFGRARSLMDSLGAQLKQAGPSIPVQILGLQDPPSPGDELDVVKNERQAKKVIESRVAQRKALENVEIKESVSLEDFFASAPSADGEKKTLNLIIRADVQGSYEAIVQAVEALSTSEVEIKVIQGGVGAINDNDVKLASTSGGVILGFNMRPISTARRIAESLDLDIKTYSIIYELINDVTLAVEGLLDPEYTEEFIGRAEVKDTFSVPKIGLIAGSAVTDGKIQVGCNIRLLRDGKIVFDGKMSSLKRFKDDVKEVKNGYECGIGLDNFTDVRVGDIFEAYMMKENKRSLDEVMKKEEAIKSQVESSL